MCHRGHKALIPGNPTLRHDIIRSPRERRALARCGRRQMIKAGKGSDTYNYNDGCRPEPRGKRPDSEDLPMGRTALEKLRSRKGASLTFALLAFLVCAVISAVLLASASAATGRLSNLAETDQRYYAVTSAAQLFCDELEGQEFDIVREETNYQVNVRAYYTDNNGTTYGRSATSEEIETWFGTDVSDKKVHPNAYTFYATGLSAPIDDTDSDTIADIRSKSMLANAALTYVLGVPTEGLGGVVNEFSVEAAYGKVPGSPFKVGSENKDEIKIGEFKLDFDITGSEDTAADTVPDIYAVAKLRKDGSIVIEFSNKGDPEGKIYTVTVTLSAEVTDNSALPPATSSDSYAFRFDPFNAISYESTVTTTVKTKTTTIKWSVTDIRKGAA